MYPLVTFQVVVPRECRCALVTLVRLLGGALLRLEHHAVEVAAVRAHRSRGWRIVRDQRHGPAGIREIVHVLLRWLVLLLVVVVMMLLAGGRVVGEAPRPGRRRGHLVMVLLGMLRRARGAPQR